MSLRLPTSVSGISGTEFGRITFVFETICSADCQLYFMMVSVCVCGPCGAHAFFSTSLPHSWHPLCPTLVWVSFLSKEALLHMCFLQDTDRRSTNVVESWEGSKEKQSYTHIMTKNASVSYTWAFQRTNQAKDVRVHTQTHIHRYCM